VSSLSSFKWIDQDVVLAIHEAQIAEHGGSSVVRDPGLLASALARPQNAQAYSDFGAPGFAALYALGIIKNHPFVDGNKRVGVILLELFLEDNGFILTVEDADLTALILAVAAGEMSDENFIQWVHEVAHQVGPT
jgi:death on curing protein